MSWSRLPIGEIQSPHFSGTIGVSPLPGAQNPLETDLATVADWQARMVISFIEQHEFDAKNLPPFGRELAQLGTAWRHYPIDDFSVPTPDFQRNWDERLHEITAILETGARVLLHCRGGLGRSGTMAAWILIHYGHSAAEAIRMVRAARGEEAIETEDQENYLREFAENRNDG